MNTRTLVCLTALLVSAFSFAEAQDVVSLPKETPYADDATGAVFPARIGSFAKTNVTKNLNPYYGTVIRYANDYGSSADVYIYALDLKTVNLSAEQWRKHYDEVKGNITHLTGKSVPLGEIAVLEEFTMKVPDEIVKKQMLASDLAGRRCSFSFSIGEDPFFSELVIFPVGSRIVKLRVTYSREITSEKANALKFLEAVCREFFEKVEFVPDQPDSQPVK